METEGLDKKKTSIAIAGITVALALVVGAWFFSQAQTANKDKALLQAQQRASGMPDPTEMQKQMLDQMAKDLRLSTDQKDKVGKIQAEMMETMRKTMMGGGNLTWEQRGEQMMQERRKNDDKIRAVLSPDQQKKFDAMQQEMAANGPPMGGMPPPGGMPPGGMPPGGMPPPGGAMRN
jgi:Spy/CpxP family protein refolding chaperone